VDHEVEQLLDLGLEFVAFGGHGLPDRVAWRRGEPRAGPPTTETALFRLGGIQTDEDDHFSSEHDFHFTLTHKPTGRKVAHWNGRSVYHSGGSHADGMQSTVLEGSSVVGCEHGGQPRVLVHLPVGPRAFDPTDVALRAAIAAGPDDDAPRLVYADRLQQQGDPRGEFIATQIAHGWHSERADALLGLHWLQWLLDDGLPVTWLSPLHWSRGFLSSFSLRGATAADLEQLIASPVGGLVHEMTLDSAEVSYDDLFLFRDRVKPRTVHSDTLRRGPA
jgi:uncharacterized protein (TIGR02996 family)